MYRTHSTLHFNQMCETGKCGLLFHEHRWSMIKLDFDSCHKSSNFYSCLQWFLNEMNACYETNRLKWIMIPHLRMFGRVWTNLLIVVFWHHPYKLMCPLRHTYKSKDFFLSKERWIDHHERTELCVFHVWR